ncbi:diaminopimelate decarboxylase [Roseospirillum parvum]|uniref:Diaminopimelate decarboxylase n=1 Tax=Roseospirillum parvum TaxID=83401 RepID=A0A1G7ZSI4_9PROT|nr:diaminopimelate decarboxylase [Roseospirillum parvum]SDH11587.1 diaminopimelate decarboxylase [Roseospirillum parvum]
MHHFTYRDGVLHAEDVALPRLAEAVGTPFYVYATATLERHYRVFRQAFEGLPHELCFAMKANGNLAVVRTLANLGAGADVVSAGEMEMALMAGVPAGRIVFSGVGKTAEEMARALKAGILQINVESEPELETLAGVAAELGLTAPVALRVNPDVAADTHHKIATGKAEDKFGIDLDRAPAVFARAAALPSLEVTGVALHIGSQITDMAPFAAAFGRIAGLVEGLKGQGIALKHIDIGGGLGIPYIEGTTPPGPAEYAAVVRQTLGHLGATIVLEPGRLIAGNAGLLVSRVVRVKEGTSRRFLILDAGMNDLLRPAMYEAHHHIHPVQAVPGEAPLRPIDVVGPVCESGDTFARGRLLPELKEGDLVALGSAGAYGAVMASTYNGRPLVPEVLVNGGRFHIVRRRPDLKEMLALESLPDWL